MRLQPAAVFGPRGSRIRIDGSFGADTTLVERADVACLLVNSAVDSVLVAADLAAVIECKLPTGAGASVLAANRRVIWFSPRSWLIQCPLDQEESLTTCIDAAFADKRVHAVRYTDALCWLELAGPNAWSLLTQSSPLGLEERELALGGSKRSLLAGVETIFVREQALVWLLGVERSRAAYLCQWLSRC